MATSTPAELAAAIGWGAVGATCNQVIALATIRAYLPRWQARIVELAAERPTATESEIGWAVVALTAFGLRRPHCRGRGLEPVQWLHDRGLPRARADRELQRRRPPSGLDHQDRQHPRPPVAGRGRLAPSTALPADHDHARPVKPAQGSAPAAARARGHAGNQRLHERWLRFNERKKRTVIANVAVARELAGWCWSLAMLEDPALPAARR